MSSAQNLCFVNWLELFKHKQQQIAHYGAITMWSSEPLWDWHVYKLQKPTVTSSQLAVGCTGHNKGAYEFVFHTVTMFSVRSVPKFNLNHLVGEPHMYTLNYSAL